MFLATVGGTKNPQTITSGPKFTPLLSPQTAKAAIFTSSNNPTMATINYGYQFWWQIVNTYLLRHPDYKIPFSDLDWRSLKGANSKSLDERIHQPSNPRPVARDLVDNYKGWIVAAIPDAATQKPAFIAEGPDPPSYNPPLGDPLGRGPWPQLRHSLSRHGHLLALTIIIAL